MPMRFTIALPLLALSACSLPVEGDHALNERQQKLMSLADTMRTEGNADASMVMLHQAANATSGNTIPHRKLSQIYIQRSKPQLAVNIMEQAVKLQPLNPGVLNHYGMALDSLGKHIEAQVQYRRALGLKPNTLSYINNLAYSLIASGKNDDAISLLQTPAAAPDAAPTLRHNLALAYGVKGDAESAVKFLDDLTPTQVEQNLAMYRSYQQNPEQIFPVIIEETMLEEPADNR